MKNPEYRCTVCRREVGRENLVAKRAQFTKLGVNGKFIRSRTVAWLCTIKVGTGQPSCLDADADYNAEKVRDAPGGLAPVPA